MVQQTCPPVSAETMPLRVAFAESSLGPVLVAATSRGVCAILLGENEDELVADFHGRFGDAGWTRVEPGDDPRLAAWARAAVAAVDHPDRAPTDDELPLDMLGTPFQRRVWRALRDIPAGQTATYTQIAERIGMSDPGAAARAVGGACGANPLAVVVPCHRVVRADGSLAGFRWGGPSKKAELLARENAAGVQAGLW